MMSLCRMTSTSEWPLYDVALSVQPLQNTHSLPGCPYPWWQGEPDCREMLIYGTESSGWSRAPVYCTQAATGIPALARASAGQAGQWTVGKRNIFNRLCDSWCPRTIPFLQGLLSQKMAVNGAVDASSLTPVPHACVLVPRAQLSAFTSHQNWHPPQSTAGVASPHYHNSKL